MTTQRIALPKPERKGSTKIPRIVRSFTRDLSQGSTEDTWLDCLLVAKVLEEGMNNSDIEQEQVPSIPSPYVVVGSSLGVPIRFRSQPEDFSEKIRSMTKGMEIVILEPVKDISIDAAKLLGRAEFPIPHVMVASRESALKILDMINNPPEPTEAMKALFREMNED